MLEGSVRKAGNRVRISVQLVKVADGYHLWSETYDRTLDDIFAVQDDIAQSVVKELRTTLLGEEADSDASGEAKAEVAQAAKGRGTDPEAHRLYLLARHLLDRCTREDTAKAIEYLKQALERDPEFALAWAELGRAYARRGGSGLGPGGGGLWRGPGRRWSGRSRWSRTWRRDMRELGWIRMMLRLGLAGCGGVVRAGAGAGARECRWCFAGPACWRANLGRLEEAIALYRRAVEQDPLSAAAYHNLGLRAPRCGSLRRGGGGVSQGAGARPAEAPRRMPFSR